MVFPTLCHADVNIEGMGQPNVPGSTCVRAGSDACTGDLHSRFRDLSRSELEPQSGGDTGGSE